MNYKLEKATNELEEAVNSSCDFEKIYNISCEIDQIIAETYKTNTRKEKLDKLINTEQARTIIVNIKSDILDYYYNISPLELEILSQNIYDYCCLMVNEIPEQEIMSYITTKNAKYYDQLSEEDRNKMVIDHNIKFFKHLTSKYIKILKSNKQS